MDDDDDDGVDLLVPVPFSVTRPARFSREQPERLKPFSFESLKHRAVIVIANGFTYRGRLVGADESELYLRAELRFWVLPLADVSGVERDDDDDDDEGPS